MLAVVLQLAQAMLNELVVVAQREVGARRTLALRLKL